MMKLAGSSATLPYLPNKTRFQPHFRETLAYGRELSHHFSWKVVFRRLIDSFYITLFYGQSLLSLIIHLGITCDMDTAQRIEGYKMGCVRHSCRKRGGEEDPTSSVLTLTTAHPPQ